MSWARFNVSREPDAPPAGAIEAISARVALFAEVQQQIPGGVPEDPTLLDGFSIESATLDRRCLRWSSS